MTTTEAAQVIGCSPGHVRYLVRAGRLRATRLPGPYNQRGYAWDIKRADAERYRDTPQRRGYPRGQPRKDVRLYR